MPGFFQARNISCAVQMAEVLGVKADNIVEGVSTAKLRCRLELAQKNPNIIIDCAHNPDAIKQVLDFIKSQAQGRLHIVCGFSSDKDIAGICEHLKIDDRIYLTKYQGKRAAEPNTLLEYVEGDTFDNSAAALDAAKSSASPDDTILIFGSIYLVKEALAHLEMI
jgi:dihydrofolate synthase/folylpolyglutamate synthase